MPATCPPNLIVFKLTTCDNILLRAQIMKTDRHFPFVPNLEHRAPFGASVCVYMCIYIYIYTYCQYKSINSVHITLLRFRHYFTL
jgi:hypothetical protein